MISTTSPLEYLAAFAIAMVTGVALGAGLVWSFARSSPTLIDETNS